MNHLTKLISMKKSELVQLIKEVISEDSSIISSSNNKLKVFPATLPSGDIGVGLQIDDGETIKLNTEQILELLKKLKLFI